jgi:predicted glycogen debranching enzyme
MDFGRDICGNIPDAQKREWLVTNGIGGYAMGTIAGSLTRRYHGLLIAALRQPLGRKLLVTKLDETIHYDGSEYRIYHNHWRDGTEEPNGYRFLERFHLEGTSPVWSYAFGDALLEKMVWMQPGANSTYIHYTLKRAQKPVAISARALVNFRDYHHTTLPHQWSADIVPVHDGLRIHAFEDAQPFFLLSNSAHWFPRHEWYENFYLEEEVYRGQSDYLDANLYAGHCNFHLGPGQSATIVVSTENAPSLNGASAYIQRLDHEKHLLERATVLDAKNWSKSTVNLPIEEGVIEQLILAADQFIVKRSTSSVADGRSIIAGFPWFSDWGRDTMIALPGLALATGRTGDAAKILRTYGQFVDRGMLPNRFPDEGDEPEYNTCDATLWYFEAVRAYYDATGDDNLLEEYGGISRAPGSTYS